MTNDTRHATARHLPRSRAVPKSRVAKSPETNDMEENTKSKLPTMMSILLICSFINACFKIFSSLVMFIVSPAISAMSENGQLEEMMQPYLSTMGQTDTAAMMESVRIAASINPNYHLITGLLFIASLIGVVMMLKINKNGLHVYSLAQLCMILASSFYVYKLMPVSPFWSDTMMTALFIVIYHLGFKQMEMRHNEQEKV